MVINNHSFDGTFISKEQPFALLPSKTCCLLFYRKKDNMGQAYNSTWMRLSQNKWEENYLGSVHPSGFLTGCVFESRWEGGDGKMKMTHCPFCHSSLCPQRSLNLPLTQPARMSADSLTNIFNKYQLVMLYVQKHLG